MLALRNHNAIPATSPMPSRLSRGVLGVRAEQEHKGRDAKRHEGDPVPPAGNRRTMLQMVPGSLRLRAAAEVLKWPQGVAMVGKQHRWFPSLQRPSAHLQRWLYARRMPPWTFLRRTRGSLSSVETSTPPPLWTTIPTLTMVLHRLALHAS